MVLPKSPKNPEMHSAHFPLTVGALGLNRNRHARILTKMLSFEYEQMRADTGDADAPTEGI